MLNVEFMYIKVYMCELSGQPIVLSVPLFSNRRVIQWVNVRKQKHDIPTLLLNIFFISNHLRNNIPYNIETFVYYISILSWKAWWKGMKRLITLNLSTIQTVWKSQRPKNSRKWLYNKAPVYMANLLKIPKSTRRSREGRKSETRIGIRVCGAYAKQGTGFHGAVA